MHISLRIVPTSAPRYYLHSLSHYTSLHAQSSSIYTDLLSCLQQCCTILNEPSDNKAVYRAQPTWSCARGSYRITTFCIGIIL